MGTVTCEVDMGEVVKAVRDVESRAQGEPLQVYAEDIKAAVDDLIQAEGAIDGREKWESLSPATLHLYPKRVGGKILQSSGLLANIQTAVGQDWFGVRSPAPYAGFHVTGTRRYGRAYMPKRDFLDVDMGELLDQLMAGMADRVLT